MVDRQVDATGVDDGNYPNPQDETTYLAVVAGGAYTMSCPAGLHYVVSSGPQPQESRCDYPENAGGMAIALSAQTAQANTEAPFVVKGLTATARDGSENPFAARIVFQAVDGTHLGSAYTDFEGVATTDSDPLTLDRDVLAQGYIARFEGSKNGTYPKAEAHGAVTFS